MIADMTVQILYALRLLATALTLLISSYVLAACVLLPTAMPSADLRALPTTANGSGNQITAVMNGDALEIDVVSESGIGQGTVAGLTPPLPDTITLRLHLKGLEKLQLTSGTTTITAQVSSSDSTITQEAASHSVAARPTTPDDPLWLTIQLPIDDESPFMVDVPSQLVESDCDTVSIEWVDFYR